LPWLLAGFLAVTALGMGGAAVAQTETAAPPSAIEGLPRIAVLTFRVHSGRATGGLDQRLADRLRRRLEASGELAVLGRETSEAVPLAELVGDAEIRALARELRADYVVLGSVTELAGRFSLDVRILPAELGRPGHTRVWTASSEAELYDRVDPVSDAVLEQVVGAAPMLVTGVEIRGAAGFERDLMKRLGTQPGLVYDAAQVRADLASLRSSPSVVSAEAETERGDDGVLVRFQIVLASPDLVASGLDAGAVIGELQIRGNRRIEPAAIRARIASREGARFDPLQVSRDIAEVHALGFFRNVRAFSDEAPDGTKILVFEVEENPVVRQISITGNDNIEGDRIRDILTLTTGSTLDQPLLYENRDRVQALYRAEGYYLAEVTFEIDSLGEASVGINFDVVENEKLKLREIVFDSRTSAASSASTPTPASCRPGSRSPRSFPARTGCGCGSKSRKGGASRWVHWK
jgi:TolB-like protein